MRAIAPRTGADEVTVAEEQEEYKPITAGVYSLGEFGHGLLLRFTFTQEERAKLAAGEDVYFMQAYPQGGPMTPVAARVGPGDWLVQDPGTAK